MRDVRDYFWRFLIVQLTFLRLLFHANGMSSVVLNATGRQTATVIFLHGLGDTGNGWSPAFEGIRLPYVKYILPNAPVKPVTLNMGFKMPSWFDIKSLNVTGAEDVSGIKESANRLRSLLEEEEKKGIASNRIVVGGFSQGGAVALYTALTHDKPLGGVIALSTWLPLHSEFTQGQRGNKDMPIFQAHGDVDPVVKFEYGDKTRQMLEKLSTRLNFKTYHGLAHSSCAQEIQDVEKWINDTLPKQD